jgi:hypothetical protein
MPYFRLIGSVSNPNITVRILGYAYYRTQTAAILLQLCKKSRSFVQNQRGAIEYEARVLRLRKSNHIIKKPPTHDQVYPLPADLNYNRFLVGVWQHFYCHSSFQFLFNDNTMSNFNISAYSDMAKFKECAVMPLDCPKIHKITIMYCNKEDSNKGRLEGLKIQDK